MVDETRLLKAATGTSVKGVEDNHRKTFVLQCPCARAGRSHPAGTVRIRDDLEVLRPAPIETVLAHEVGVIVGKVLRSAVTAGQDLRWDVLV
jgi:sialic acid synthase SpsE